MNKIKLNIVSLNIIESQPENFSLFLEEEMGTRRLPIIIGGFEAQAIAVALEHLKLNRPLTHDLFPNLLKELGASIKEVIISDLIEGVFHATIVCKKPDGTDFPLDARSSDAIAIAVRFDCPIYTTEEIMKSTGVVPAGSTESTPKKREKLSDYTKKELKEQLDQALEKEDYESAAKIRNAMEEKQKGDS